MKPKWKPFVKQPKRIGEQQPRKPLPGQMELPLVHQEHEPNREIPAKQASNRLKSSDQR
jgi:hypothetical protein